MFFFFLSFFFNVSMNNVPFISYSAVKVLAAQSSETALKLKSIWFGHYAFLFFRKMPLPLQKLFEQWIWHTFVISCNNECCPCSLEMGEFTNCSKKNSLIYDQSAVLPTLSHQITAPLLESHEQPVRNDTAFSCFAQHTSCAPLCCTY